MQSFENKHGPWNSTSQTLSCLLWKSLPTFCRLQVDVALHEELGVQVIRSAQEVALCSRCHRSSHHMRPCVIITSLVSTQLCYAYLNCQDRSKVNGYLDNHVNEVCWFDFWRFLLFFASGLINGLPLDWVFAEWWNLLTGLHDYWFIQNGFL